MQKCVGSFFLSPFPLLFGFIFSITGTYLLSSFRVSKKVCIFA